MRLFAFERRWLSSVFDTILPPGAGRALPGGAHGESLDGFVDELCRLAPLDVVWGARACLWLVVLAPLFLLGRPATFASLSRAERLRVLDRLRESPVYLLREIPLFFKMLGCLGFCGLPSVHARLGLEPRDSEPPAWALGDSGDRQ